MPKLPRPVSEYGYYHLVIRGNNKQIIFEEREDYVHFLNLLKKFSAEFQVSINAFCLMENHVHLLVYHTDSNIPIFMKYLAGTYAVWFNQKYNKVGHLFQGRYISKPVESDDSLCRVFRYIINNPKDAGMCPAKDYLWNSYSRYGNPNSFVDTKIFLELLGNFEEYDAYLNENYEIDSSFESWDHDDEWAKSVIHETLGIESGTIIQTYDLERRNQAIRTLREKGLSIRQISRLTGISKSVIQRI